MLGALTVFYLVGLSPEQYWIIGFIGYSIPIFLIIHGLFLIYFILKKSWKIVIPIVVFIVGWPHLRSTIQFSPKQEIESNSLLKVVNFNVRVFNVYDHLKGDDPDMPTDMIEWLTGQDAAVLCLQEYYNDNSSEVYNVSQRIKAQGYKYSNINTNKENRIGAQFGQAIFSKLPIVSEGVVSYNNEVKNKAIFVDVLYKQDTIRIYNTHFYSMKLRVQDFVEEEKELKRLVKLKEALKRIKRGFIEHSKEADILKAHIGESPYPVILAGDFNDIPYSYTYLSFRSFLQNSFEEAGNGFGFTYNESPSFIRIDNQFSSMDFEVVTHDVHEEVKYSDHYPISVNYQINNGKGKSL